MMKHSTVQMTEIAEATEHLTVMGFHSSRSIHHARPINSASLNATVNQIASSEIVVVNGALKLSDD